MSNQFNTLEGLSHALGKYLFFTNKLIDNVVIKIEKPNAPIDCHIQSVSVEICRKPSDYATLSHESPMILTEKV